MAQKLRLSSRWLPMSDGIRVAVDVLLPPSDDQAPFPTVVTATRYWRSFALRSPERPDRAPIGPRAAIGDELVRRGFAVVVIDARGTGASEGTWPCPWSPRERRDTIEVVDWIVAQPWSNGLVGATGISYEGTTAMMLAASGHPAVKAVVAREFEYDVYSDIAHPGGVFNEAFCRAWSEMTAALDRDSPPRQFGLTARLLVKGARPTDEDPKGRELTAIVERRANPSVIDALESIEFRDDEYGDQAVTLDDLSLHRMADAIRDANVPAQLWGSWRDGTTADSVLRMYAELPSVREAWIGAWAHTGEQHGSPFVEGVAPDPTLSEQWAKIIDFLEGPLRGRRASPAERCLHYFVMGAEAWRTTPSWPPGGVQPTVLYLTADRRLSPAPPDKVARERMQLDPRATTGTRNRWYTQLALPLRYGDRARADQRLATWAWTTLAAPLEIVGHPTLRLRVATDHDDLTLFAYLEAVDPRGRVRLLTEGLFRALHRGGGDTRPTFRRADARRLVPGDPFDLTIRLLPTAVLVPAGWAIRLAIAGADADTFRTPADPRALDISLAYDPDHPASLALPVRR
jgi:hypothetical protein